MNTVAPPTAGPVVLAIESSCDETAAAVLTGTRELQSNVVHSQVDIHARYGGVVPELASRNHVLAITDVVDRALNEAHVSVHDVEGIVVTQGPGLVGSLLVGIEFAKGLAQRLDVPVLGVHHLEGHLMAPFLESAEGFEPVEYPFTALVVSGGHTSIFDVSGPGQYEEMGRTLDDAAGEAFDKVSKLLGLGYPGGAVIDRLAREGDPTAIEMPRPMIKKPGYHTSFSGLKTYAANHIESVGVPAEGQPLMDFCASFQQAIAEVLTIRTFRAAQDRGRTRVLISGGVAANSGLRAQMKRRGAKKGVWVSAPPLRLCTDNAAMIGAAGYGRVFERIATGVGFDGGGLDAVPSWPLGRSLPRAGRGAAKRGTVR